GGRGAGAGAGPEPEKPGGMAAGGSGWAPLRDAIRRDVEQAISALAFAERLHQKMDTQRRAFLDFPRIMEQLRSGAVERLTASLSRLYEGGQGFDLQRFLRDLPLALGQLAAAALAGPLARGPRSPRGSAACRRVRAKALRRLRRRLGRSAADEGPGRADRGGAGSVPSLDAAGSLRRAGRARLHERAAALEARAARDQRCERGGAAAAGHRGLARRGGGGLGARTSRRAGGRAGVAAAARRGAGAGPRLMRALAAASAAALAASASLAEENSPFYFQATVAGQAHHEFHAPYSGKNSLRPQSESALSVVMDLGARIHPWGGAELVVQPELAGGRGLSAT